MFRQVTESDLSNFRELLEKALREMNGHDDIVISIESGKKYARIVYARNGALSRSAYGFIDLTNGNLMKAASWSAPMKNRPRGNIFSENPLNGCDRYGMMYLR